MASPMERRSSIPALGYTARPVDYEKYGPVHRDFYILPGRPATVTTGLTLPQLDESEDDEERR